MSLLLLSAVDLVIASVAIVLASLIGFQRGRATCPACERRRRLDRQLARAEAARREHLSVKLVEPSNVVVPLPTLAQRVARELRTQARRSGSDLGLR